MPLYQRPGSPFYYFEFQYRGHRFRGSTGTPNRREAERFEKAKIEAVKKKIDDEEANGGKRKPLTMDEACDRYWLEVGKHLKRSDQVSWSLAWLLDFFGKDKLISEINNSDVAAMVARRRGESRHNKMQEAARAMGRKDVNEVKLVALSTVNRSVTEPLRKVLNRARDEWEETVRPIKWGKHMLKEPGERVRAATTDEEQRFFEALPEQYHAIVRFALRTGCRISECVNLPWSAIDWGDRKMSIHGKGDKIATVPMSKDVRDLLWSLRGQHATRVFVYPEKRKLFKDGTEHVTPAKPMTYSGVDTAWGRAITKAKVENLRFHDLRHTAATRLLRDTGNLKMVQKLLRHNQIKTTSKYAHVFDQDLQDALDAQADRMQEVPTLSPTADIPLRKKAGE